MTDPWALDDKRFVWRQLDGEYLILDLDSGDYFTLEGTGSAVFDWILKGRTMQEMEETMSLEYPDAAAKHVRRDLEHFVAQLSKLKLLSGKAV